MVGGIGVGGIGVGGTGEGETLIAMKVGGRVGNDVGVKVGMSMAGMLPDGFLDICGKLQASMTMSRSEGSEKRRNLDMVYPPFCAYRKVEKSPAGTEILSILILENVIADDVQLALQKLQESFLNANLLLTFLLFVILFYKASVLKTSSEEVLE